MASVLVVDDEESVHRSIEPYLGEYEVFHAFNGRQAREALVQHRVDVVLLDLNLPDTTGFELLEEIGSSKTQPKVLMLSAHHSPANVARAIQLGAHGFLHKTFEVYRALGGHVATVLVGDVP